LARRRLDPDASSVGLDEATNYRQAEAGSTMTCAACIGAEEGLEDLFSIRHRNSWAAVHHTDHDPVVEARGTDEHRMSPGMAVGVLEQVGEGALKLYRVGLDLGEVVGDLDAEG
jgi:hypothetical protein